MKSIFITKEDAKSILFNDIFAYIENLVGVKPLKIECQTTPSGVKVRVVL